MSSPTSTLYYNGHVHTFESPDTVYSCIGTNGKLIDYVGDNPNESCYKHMVDLKGAHVAPTLTDSHVHLLYSMVLAAQSFMLCELQDQKVEPHDLHGIKERLEAYCAQHPQQKLIVANGYITPGIKENRLPTKEELDLWCDGRAVIIYNMDGHSSALSTKTMELLKLDPATSDGILRNEEHDFMQGRLTDLVASTLTFKTIRTGIANYVNECHALGITRICALDGNEDLDNDRITRFLAIIAAKLPLDIAFFPQYTTFDKARRIFSKQRHKRLGGCMAWELDGSISSQSAAFDTPFLVSGECGHCYHEASFIQEKVRKAHEQDIQLTCHAIGPLAIDQIIRAYELCPPRADSDRPMNRIDHCEFPSKEAVAKLKTMDLAITIQPGFAYVDKRYMHGYEQYLDEDMRQLAIPLKTLCEAGVCLCGSTDSPVQSMDPYLQLQGMVDYYLPTQSLTPYQAYETYSINGARMLGEDASLKAGNRASFNIYSSDPTVQVPNKEELIATIHEGKKATPMKPSVGTFLKLLFSQSKPL